MGLNCGFDIFPALEPTEENKRAYRAFLDEVIATYSDKHDDESERHDGKVLELPDDSDANWHRTNKHYIYIMMGECPKMPAHPGHCGYFLRFTSKVNGRLAGAERYIRGMCQIARKHLGYRVRFWHEADVYGTDMDRFGYYSWTEVFDVERELKALPVEGESVASGQRDTEVKDQDSSGL
jgi:hypothetical protein